MGSEKVGLLYLDDEHIIGDPNGSLDIDCTQGEGTPVSIRLPVSDVAVT
ncbi:MAG: hypothetical protein WD492_00120 [Alkalispirochaeta sp.]